jgi:hypothetical protein
MIPIQFRKTITTTTTQMLVTLHSHCCKNLKSNITITVRFEVITVVAMNSFVFWDIKAM